MQLEKSTFLKKQGWQKTMYGQTDELSDKADVQKEIIK